MKIPDFLVRDHYLQIPIMHRFLKDHKIPIVYNTADYTKSIEEYANMSVDNEQEVVEWLKTVAKEGAKEICYRKIYGIEDWHKDPNLVEEKINSIFPDCPNKNIINYKNTEKQTLIDYDLFWNEDSDELERIEFVFSRLYLCGETDKLGDTTICPMHVEVYLDEGFIISRCKAKATLFYYDQDNKYLISDYKVNTMNDAVELIDKIVEIFGFETELDSKKIKNEVYQLHYKIYKQYTFTPEDVVKKVNSQKSLAMDFVNQLFTNLQLDVRNKKEALSDAKILIEKYISINGDNEDIFKKDRSAYLIKVASDNESDSTKIDTQSSKTTPLQCTPVFFDSKKSVVTSKMGKRLHLIFKRQNEHIFSKTNPLVVQFGVKSNFGYVKTTQYAEEVDIQNVLQAIFSNYQSA